MHFGCVMKKLLVETSTTSRCTIPSWCHWRTVAGEILSIACEAQPVWPQRDVDRPHLTSCLALHTLLALQAKLAGRLAIYNHTAFKMFCWYRSCHWGPYTHLRPSLEMDTFTILFLENFCLVLTASRIAGVRGSESWCIYGLGKHWRFASDAKSLWIILSFGLDNLWLSKYKGPGYVDNLTPETKTCFWHGNTSDDAISGEHALPYPSSRLSDHAPKAPIHLSIRGNSCCANAICHCISDQKKCMHWF